MTDEREDDDMSADQDKNPGKDDVKKDDQAPEKEQQGPDTPDEKADEWGEESFPGSDAPANY